MNFKESFEKILYPKDLCLNLYKSEDFKNYYENKYNICKEHHPSIIVEIGVRAGYSAWAFLQACPQAQYFGFDANNGLHGGFGGEDGCYFEWAKQILSSYDFALVELDTQKVKSLNLKSVDFFHVDGDHTASGVEHDLTLAFDSIRSGGLILVDDVNYLKDVKIGVNRWLDRYFDLVFFEERKSLRGEMLIYKRYEGEKS